MGDSRFDNIFILCTGRCGSMTFIRACGHITNYSVGHETKINSAYDKISNRLRYPKYHIEADNRLSFFLGAMDNYYPDDRTFYVHLVRNEDKVVESFSSRSGDKSLADNYIRGILYKNYTGADRKDLIRIMAQAINYNIQSFLATKKNYIYIPIERVKTLFPIFCDLIRAQVDLLKTARELDKKYNQRVNYS